MIKDNYKRSSIPYPQYMHCHSKRSDVKSSHGAEQATKKVCEDLYNKCEANKKDCTPSSATKARAKKIKMTKTLIMEAYRGPRCRISTPKMYQWFSAMCKAADKNLDLVCQRTGLYAANGGADAYDLPCNDDQPPDKLDSHDNSAFFWDRWDRS
jgi:hypothetical protein